MGVARECISHLPSSKILHSFLDHYHFVNGIASGLFLWVGTQDTVSHDEIHACQ
jgi:hypothetical protein